MPTVYFRPIYTHAYMHANTHTHMGSHIHANVDTHINRHVIQLYTSRKDKSSLVYKPT